MDSRCSRSSHPRYSETSGENASAQSCQITHHGAIALGIEPSADLRFVEFAFLEHLEEINLCEVPAGLAGLIESKARAAGVIVSDDY